MRVVQEVAHSDGSKACPDGVTQRPARVQPSSERTPKLPPLPLCVAGACARACTSHLFVGKLLLELCVQTLDFKVMVLATARSPTAVQSTQQNSNPAASRLRHLGLLW